MNGYFKTDCQIVTVTGEKASALLHGQFTNHIKGLLDGAANENLFLTQKGKVLANLWVGRNGNDYDLIIKKSFVDLIVNHLQKLAPLSNVTLTPKSASVFHLLLKDGKMEIFNSLKKYQTNRLGLNGTDIFVENEKECEKIFEKILLDKNISVIDENRQKEIRIRNNFAEVGVDVTEDNLPQEGNLKRALHFNKGCYLGQETVARLEYRGHVSKELTPLLIPYEKNELLEGTFIYEKTDLENNMGGNIKNSGKITSSFFDTIKKEHLALGYCRYVKEGEAKPEFFIQIAEKEIPAILYTTT